ncbi:MAG: TIGR04282 family arsenosugar biosynthesis glycosyltransferase [Pseudomonadota bacterium]
MTCNNRLLLFTRYPEVGRTKTRLIPALGAEAAARLQWVLTERIIRQAKSLAEEYGIPTTVHYSGGSKEDMASWLGPLTYVVQAQGDLGLRMQKAFTHTFAEGTESAVLIGSDIPDISVPLLTEAFAALLNAKAVIGPSHDGGYYLIGLRSDGARALYPLLFEEMVWSTPTVFAQTLERLNTTGASIAVLPTLRDIDLPDDLQFAQEKGLL